MKTIFLSSLMLFATFFCFSAQAEQITSTFDTDADGWSSDGMVTLAHIVAGGNPGGYVRLAREEEP